MLTLFGLALALALVSAQTYTPPFKMATPTTFQKVNSTGNSTLYLTMSTGYADPIELIDLWGDHYEVGRAQGVLLGEQAVENLNALMDMVLPKEWERDVINDFLDWQWQDYLQVQLPSFWKDEIAGFAAGALSVGIAGTQDLIQRSLVLGNFPGDVNSNIEWLVYGEIPHKLSPERSLMLSKLKLMLAEHKAQRAADPKRGMHCSQLAVWGSRTVGGNMYATRNLDWYADSGIAKHKVIGVYHITGKIPYTTVGFAGMIGALTGMNAAGVTMGESGSDVKPETFLGYAWLLRMREVLETSTNLADALAFVASTNNTLGMNHVIASQSDAMKPNTHAAFAMETMRGYTAIFFDNDTREYEYPLGAPMPEAVYRTNHGVDPKIRENAVGTNTATSDSEVRYMIFANSLKWYQQANVIVDIEQAINMTALVGDKGTGHTYADFYGGCSLPNVYKGSTIISAAFAPASNLMYVAYEEGTGPAHRPACCGTYVLFDMSKWM